MQESIILLLLLGYFHLFTIMCLLIKKISL